MVEYKDRLKVAMGKTVTVQQLASAIGLSYQAIKKVVDGKSKALSAENNSKAARFLKVRADWLATGDGEMHPKKITAAVVDMVPRAAGWPFSDEVLRKLATADTVKVRKCENLVRFELGIPMLVDHVENNKVVRH